MHGNCLGFTCLHAICNQVLDFVCFGQCGFLNLGSIEPKSNMLMMFLMINVIEMNLGSYACMISCNLNEPMHVSATLSGLRI